MNTIAVEGMRFYAKHGFYNQEAILGGWYSVDVYASTDFRKAAANDELGETLNYETIFLISKFQMAKPAKLIETVAYNIINDIKHKYSGIQVLKVRITKHFPPLGGDVARAIVEIEETYQKSCAKCKKGFFCYNDGNCWCHEVRVSPEIQRILKVQFSGCLCRKCLSDYSH
ncbi:MAG: dihydroneopterin aldolase [Bacteroidota bacterium]